MGTIVTPRSEGAPGHTWVSIPKESEISVKRAPEMSYDLQGRDAASG